MELLGERERLLLSLLRNKFKQNIWKMTSSVCQLINITASIFLHCHFVLLVSMPPPFSSLDIHLSSLSSVYPLWRRPLVSAPSFDKPSLSLQNKRPGAVFCWGGRVSGAGESWFSEPQGVGGMRGRLLWRIERPLIKSTLSRTLRSQKAEKQPLLHPRAEPMTRLACQPVLSKVGSQSQPLNKCRVTAGVKVSPAALLCC